MQSLLSLALVWLGGPVAALTLAFPDPATETAASAAPLDSYRLPTGPFDGTTVPTRLAEGAVEARAWRIDGSEHSTLALMQALRAQVLEQGYRPIYDCEGQACGGFDFRFATTVLPEPAMHVDLGDFRYLAAEKGAEVVSLIVSRSSSAGYVQMTRVTPALAPVPRPATPDETALAPVVVPPSLPDIETEPVSTVESDAGGLVARLEGQGSASLDDLRFAAGATDLEPGDYASLAALAEWLKAAPGRQVALVGHTDASGGLETNIAISRRRAAEVRSVLVGQLGVPRAQVTAEGVGYLAPRATNLTEDGRQANRRVEVVVTKAE